MGAHAAAKLPFSAKKMRRQAPTAKMLRQQALVNEAEDTLDFVKVLKLMNEKHIASDISAFFQKSRVDGSNKWTCGPQENVKLNITDIINHPVSGDNELGSALKRASSSSVRGEEPQGQVSEIRIPESQSTAGSWRTVTEAEKEQEDSDAISDTSFTPPKYLARCARYDDEGRRLPPPRFGNAAPKQQKQSRFVHGDGKGRKHLMPPPGFHGALPRLIDESPVVLKFERKQDFKKEFEKRQVTHGGISLAVTRKQSSRSEGKKNKRSLDISAGRSSVSKKEQSASLKKPAESPATNHLIGGWESALLKGVFDAEEDLLYGGRWPASTF
ncbi:hypothetical protein F4860DRAFT_525661 [Xylaria cubensis]|nr:hypothetical protein F4860DRAFT_525661 [Xylaria cubensis]